MSSKKILFKSDYLKELRFNENNKNSIWLNFLFFFIPIWGLFAIFYYLLKSPKRSKGILKWTILGILFQLMFIFSCKLFLFGVLSDYLITFLG